MSSDLLSRSPLDGYDVGGFWDEMFVEGSEVRPHYVSLAAALHQLSPADVDQLQRTADLSFQARGITFSVNQSTEGVEKIMPFDLAPRILSAREWEHLQEGVEQRILKQEVIPAEVVLSSRGYRRELNGLDVPLGVYTHVSGIDLVRDGTGAFYVLEDNVRVPSGVSYVIENRRVLKRTWPQIFRGYDVRPVEGYPQDLLEVLTAIATPGVAEPTIGVLTPGVYNSAYFEHTFLARAMGAELVQDSDLLVDDGAVYMRTTRGRVRIDVLYRRVDDDFSDPLAFRPDSLLGVPGLLASYRMGRISLANALGTGVADDKAVYAYVPSMIRYYLGEDPILPNVPTYVGADARDLLYILENLDDLVVKAVDERGGYGMLIGPHATAAERSAFRERVRADPRRYVAQPMLALSRHPCWVGDHFEGRHIDLRPFVLFGREVRILPGGLTRVALRKGSLVVNSSQGGGSKDTWVLGSEAPAAAMEGAT